MAITKSLRYKIDFIDNCINNNFDTFNAQSAIYLAEQLREESISLGKIINDKYKIDSYSLHFPNYYIVGFITCLEWHARSRLYDLLRYDHANFSADDIKQLGLSSNLDTLLRENLNIAQLVAASTLVTNFTKYNDIFNRIFDYLNIDEKPINISKKIIEEKSKLPFNFHNLFEERHATVHEISASQVGHFNLRFSTSLSDVDRIGTSVILLMKGIEERISRAGRDDFPNLFLENNYISRNNILKNRIKSIEGRILRAMNDSEDSEAYLNLVERSFLLSNIHIDNEIEIFMTMDYPGRKYNSVSEKIIELMLENRLKYISNLERILLEVGVINYNS